MTYPKEYPFSTFFLLILDLLNVEVKVIYNRKINKNNTQVTLSCLPPTTNLNQTS